MKKTLPTLEGFFLSIVKNPYVRIFTGYFIDFQSRNHRFLDKSRHNAILQIAEIVRVSPSKNTHSIFKTLSVLVLSAIISRSLS